MPYILEKDPRTSSQLPQRKLLSQTTQKISNIPKPARLTRPAGNGVNHASRPSMGIPDTPKKTMGNDFKLPQKAPVQKKRCIEFNPEIPALELKPFAEQPVVDFGEVCIDDTRVKYITVRNLQNLQQRLFVKSFPKQDNGFSIDSTDFLIAPKTEIFIALAWTPKSVGPIRDSIALQDASRSTFRIILIGRAVPALRSSSKINPRAQSRPTPVTQNRFSPPKLNRRLNLDKVLFSPRSKNLLGKGVNIKPLTKLKAAAGRRQSGQIVVNMLSKNNEAMITKVQSAWRMILAKRQLEDLRSRQRAVITIQSFWRMALARRQLEDLRSRQRAIITIQSFWRGILERRKLQSTIKFQSRCRGFILRSRLRKSIQVQSIWRMILAKRQLEELRSRQRAIIAIQSFWRMILAKRQLEDLRSRQRAVIIIQSFWRMVIARRQLKDLRSRLRAIITIQSFWRSILERRKLQRTIKFQSHCRGFILRLRLKKSIQVQSIWRMILAKRQLEDLRSRQRAIIIIQAFWRMVLAKRQLEELRSRLRAIVIIQSVWRGILERRKLQRTIKFQSYCRGFILRLRLRKSIEALSRVQNRYSILR